MPYNSEDSQQRGRPTNYTEALAEEICDRLASGESLLHMCHDDHIPAQGVIFQWLRKHESFREKYAIARQYWAEAEFEKLMQIADTPQVGIKTKTVESEGKVTNETISMDMTDHRRLQVDARKWALARMNGRRFGDKASVEHSGPGGTAVAFEIINIPGKVE